MSSNFSCGEKASLYTLSLLVCFLYPFYTLKPSSLKESYIFSVSSFSIKFLSSLQRIAPTPFQQNCSYQSHQPTPCCWRRWSILISHLHWLLSSICWINQQLITLSALMQMPHLAYSTIHLAVSFLPSWPLLLSVFTELSFLLTPKCQSTPSFCPWFSSLSILTC